MFEKVKKFYKDNKMVFSASATAITGLLLMYFGFKKGVRKADVENKEEEVAHLKSKAEVVILKEKLDDSQKDIDEISSDVDDILDHK